MDFIDYRKKLGIGFNDRELENIFFNRIFNVLGGLADMEYQISSKEYADFCHAIGFKMKHGLYPDEIWEETMKILDSSRTVNEFLGFYMFFIKTQKDNAYKSWSKEGFKKLLCDCLTDSHIPFDVLKDKDGYFIFPKGAEELDDALVSEPLEWLNEYPKTRVEFVQALKDYSDLNDDNASDVADKFRKALERFFQEFFNKKDKNLENLKSDYGKFMESKGVSNELSNNFQNLLEAYTKFMNNHAKHQNKTNKNLLEYIMYQTGNIIRLMITLKKEGN